MAMTKAEQAHVESLERGIKLAKAMRWPEYNQPAPMTQAQIDAAKPSKTFGTVARGWFGNSHTLRVTYGCSSGVSHSVEGDKTTSQKIGVMYETQLDALRAIRCEMTERFATLLAGIDARIEGCIEDPTMLSEQEQ